MPPSNAAQIATAFDLEVTQLLAVAEGGAGPSADQAVSERLLEAVFLNAVTAVEALFERLFFYAVTGRLRTMGVRPVVRFRDEATARRMVLPPKHTYLDWLPFPSTVDRARVFLVDALPFARVDARVQLSQQLQAAVTVRNMIAHRSDHARDRFERLVDGRYDTAGSYLAASTSSGRVCESFLADFGRIANGLCARDDAAAVVILGDVDPLPAGAKRDSGTYECVTCGTRVVVAEATRVSLACAVCDPPCPVCGRTPRTARFRVS